MATLELIAQEINSNNLAGAVAELRVYKGAFAKDINLVFAERKFYLFDTFKGFEASDLQAESQQGLETKNRLF